MNSYRLNDQKKFCNSYLKSNHENSMLSNKSKNSFKDLNEYRNHTPQERSIHLNQQSASKIQQILSNLVQTDQIQSKSLFGQSLREKQDLKQTDNFSKSIQQKASKMFKTNDTYFKQQLNASSSTRELNQNNENLQNLYYMFQNKHQESQSKQNVLTLSQLAKQYQQQKNNTEKTPQRNGLNNNQNKESCQSSVYINQIQQLKQKIDHSLQKKTSPKTEKYQLQNESKIQKTSGIISNFNRHQQDINSFGQAEEISEQLIQIVLQKELLWNQISQNLEKLQYSALVNHCQELHQILNQVSEQKNSEYLYNIDINIIDTILLESFTILIILMEQPKEELIIDQNLKNLIVYITQSNFYLIQTINSAVIHPLLKQRIELRQFQQKKQQSKAKQTLQKNNFIIRSILELIKQSILGIDDTTHPDIYSQLEFKQQNLDSYFVQQNKILNQITNQLQKDITPKISNNIKNVNFIEKKKQPLLPSKPSKNYTLVLDLDETLVHYQEFPNGGGQFLVRPYTEEFLEKLSKYYEIVIFTSAQPDYANFIIDIIDKQQVVKARLYREHTLAKDNIYIKDLSIIGRSLNKVIIVDNMPENFQMQPENGIYIQSWTGEQKDRALKDLMPLLEQIAIKKCKDVREALNQFREQMIQNVQQGIRNPYENLQLE